MPFLRRCASDTKPQAGFRIDRKSKQIFTKIAFPQLPQEQFNLFAKTGSNKFLSEILAHKANTLICVFQ